MPAPQDLAIDHNLHSTILSILSKVILVFTIKSIDHIHDQLTLETVPLGV